MENSKTTCIFFKSLYDAAKELKKTDPMTALEIYSAYFDYAFGVTEKVETDSQIARLLVMQNVDSLNAATRRYNTAVDNGNKGKEYGILGKEYGKKGGRPRKGETKEQANERRENEAKTPQKTPLTVAVSEAVSNSKSISNSKDISIDNKITKEQITEVIDIPIKERDTEKESETPGTPNPERKVIGRFDNFDFASAYALPEMESRLECQYYYVWKELPTYEINRKFNEDSLRWEEDQDISTLTNCMLYWYDGGREKLAEMVQGLPPKVTKDLIAYLVLYCKDYDTSGYYTPRYETVYV